MRFIFILFLFLSSVAFGQSTFLRTGLTSGTDTYTLAVTSLSSYTGTEISARFSNANTGAATVNINSLGAIALRKWDGAAWVVLTGGELNTTTIYRLSYTSVGPYFQVHQDGAGGGAADFSTITGDPRDNSQLADYLDEKGDAFVTARVLTGAHTLDATDLASINSGDQLDLQGNNGGALTVPLNSSVAFPVGSGFSASGFTGNVIATGGVTITGTQGNLEFPPGESIFLIKTATDTWTLNNGLPDASTTVKGLVELATDAETITGTDAVRATTPAGVAAAIAAGGGGAVSSVFTRTGAVTATAGDYTATQVTNTPAGGIAATNVQTALNELDTEKATTASVDAKVADAINDGTTTIAPSQNAVFDALALKENAANKVTDFTTLNNTLFPTTQAVENRLASITAMPGVNFAPAQSFDPTFVVFASAIVRASNAYTLSGPITWEFLTQASSHNYSFYETAAGVGGSGALQINYPSVKNVLNVQTGDDESFASHGVICGATVGLSNMQMFAYRPGILSLRLRGQSTTTWSLNGTSTGSYSIGTIASGQTGFNVTGASVTNIDYSSMNISYIGTNNYGIRRVYSGLGANSIGFLMVDRFTGSDVTTNPTSSDEVMISNSGVIPFQLHLATYATSNQFLAGPSTPYNFWIWGVFECWMVAVPLTTSTVQLRWQPSYPSATNYKLYRDTSAAFSSPTLIHTGTSGSYLDTGLSTNTLYYYKLVAVVSGVDTDVTTFKTNTKAY